MAVIVRGSALIERDFGRVELGPVTWERRLLFVEVGQVSSKARAC